MAKDHLICDRTEIIATLLMGNRWANVSARADRIRRIQFDFIDVRRFIFLKSRDERISVEVSGGAPITFLRSAEKQFFDEYKTRLAKFAKDNNITFADLTQP